MVKYVFLCLLAALIAISAGAAPQFNPSGRSGGIDDGGNDRGHHGGTHGLNSIRRRGDDGPHHGHHRGGDDPVNHK
jgi:hypothetical protein